MTDTIVQYKPRCQPFMNPFGTLYKALASPTNGKLKLGDEGVVGQDSSAVLSFHFIPRAYPPKLTD